MEKKGGSIERVKGYKYIEIEGRRSDAYKEVREQSSLNGDMFVILVDTAGEYHCLFIARLFSLHADSLKHFFD